MTNENKILSTVNNEIPSYYNEDLRQIKSFKRKLSHFHYIKKISKYLKHRTDPAILDIGCGTGSFLYHCEKKLPNVSLHGFEYDYRLIAQARKNLKRSIVTQGNAEKIEYNKSKFDIITSFQVIEHIYDPEKMLSEIFRILKPGGILLITTPNLEGLGRRLDRDSWIGYRDDHVSLKGYCEWDTLIQKSGFTKISAGSTFFSGIKIMRHFPFSIVNNFLLGCFGWAPWKLGESFVGLYVKNK